jgi:uncharacterized protein DUF4062
MPDFWNDLIIERGARALPLSDDRFRQWMAGRGIFVSSRMDQEMTPSRDAVRAYLNSKGADSVMWEDIAPRDEQGQQAYLNGVDRSSIFVLLLGRWYGISDSTGFSPTHQEERRAVERRIPRLLFTIAGIQASEREGKLNNWLNSLYNEISGANYTTPEDLVSQLDARLRKMAAQAEGIWIKLGSLIFPGKVSSDFHSSSGGQFTVTARVAEGSMRHALLSIKHILGHTRVRADRLTWSSQSFPVQVESVSAESTFTTEDAIKIVCRTPNNWYGESGSTFAGMSIGSGVGHRMITQSELAEIWARRAILGEPYQGDVGYSSRSCISPALWKYPAG